MSLKWGSVGHIAALWGQGDGFLKCETTPAAHDSNQLGPVSWWYIELFLVVKVSVPFSFAPACLRSRRKMENGLMYDYVKPNIAEIRSDNVYGKYFLTHSLISGIRSRFKTLYCPARQFKYWMIKIKWWPAAVVDFYQMVYQQNKQSLKKIKARKKDGNNYSFLVMLLLQWHLLDILCVSRINVQQWYYWY